jgi:hypothetical protein
MKPMEWLFDCITIINTVIFDYVSLTFRNTVKIISNIAPTLGDQGCSYF